MRVLDLFSGIGGFSLGLERAGMRTVAFCEIDPFCRRVLAKHWPDTPIIEDITNAKFPDAEVICGGFPCQDISLAGDGAGLAGERSGLWRELVRAIRLVRPRYTIVENVAALLGRGMGNVLGDLAESGYDAQWDCIRASDIGADHERDRVWIVADTDAPRLPWGMQAGTHRTNAGDISARIGFAVSAAPEFPGDYRKHQPVLGGRLHGVPDRVDRLKALGNAVLPQIPEIIGRAIMKAELVPNTSTIGAEGEKS